MRSISAIVPNYNGRELLEKNLPSLIQELSRACQDFEVIIVDDCSTDDSVDFLNAHYAEHIIIAKEKNEGFSATCNAGIQRASKALIFLMNSDIILTEGYFEPQFKYFEQEDTFGVMGKIIGYFDDKIQDTAKLPIMRGLKLKADNNYLLEDHQEGFWTPTIYLSGANALMDAQKLKAMGGFDEIYSPFYSEDLDLGIRAHRLHWKCYYEHQAVCRHEGSVSTGKLRKTWVDTIARRNRFFVHGIHYNGWRLWLYNLQIAFEMMFRWVNFRFGVYFGYWEYLNSSKKMRQSKKQLEALAYPKKPLSLKEIVQRHYDSIAPYHIKRV
ncbi:glycosyltransferase family 2 protein [Persicobacter diffluens]|uniref:Glycosyltransferase 2-like domain-containing protein n=1 Tax=Persicobacter diffluens TaxID=981 RepID=A0AAN5AKC6_9BACT|nr:hypothetical protein PEDI_03100 [Persicobacter diffluens]